MASECSVSVVLGENSRGSALCAIKDMVMLYQPSPDQLKQAVESLFSRNGLTSHDIAGILSGFNGSEGSRKDYCDHYGELFGDIPMLHYKHLFGECYSASALSMYVAACCLTERTIPQALYVASSAEPVGISEHPALVLYSNDGKNHSLTLLTAV